jgi:hypothetical protein
VESSVTTDSDFTHLDVMAVLRTIAIYRPVCRNVLSPR